MIRFVIRHAKASHDPSIPTDDDRPLTDKGHAQAAFLARALAEHPAPPARIISSPILRAQETAEHIAEALGLDVETEEALSTHSWSGDATDFFLSIDDPLPVAIVGHNPTFSIIATECARSSISLKTGMCAVLEFQSGPAAATLRELIRMRCAKS